MREKNGSLKTAQKKALTHSLKCVGLNTRRWHHLLQAFICVKLQWKMNHRQQSQTKHWFLKNLGKQSQNVWSNMNGGGLG